MVCTPLEIHTLSRIILAIAAVLCTVEWFRNWSMWHDTDND